ncbi:MAG: DUF5940 domain-containing protein [Pseudomonadales bacterium]
MSDPVIQSISCCLAHAPDLVRYGSKPRREIARDPAFAAALGRRLRSFDDALAYPPNRTFIGRLTPDELAAVPRPWFEQRTVPATPGQRPFGTILPQSALYELLARADVLEPELVLPGDDAPVRQAIAAGALPLLDGAALWGCMRRDDRAEGRDDDSLSASILLEALVSKATGAAALLQLIEREGIDPASLEFIISCGEEACGDRYQRGGGGMAKSIGEMCGLANASGMDVKNFCAGPGSALMTAAAMVQAGLYQRIAVVAGGSLAKLGMKCQAFIREGLPILDDCLASMALVVSADDGRSPHLLTRRGSFGIARIGASTSDEAVYRQLILEPLAALGLGIADIDRFAPELHNPEIMEHAGSGDVVRKNYRMIAATAVRAGIIGKAEMEPFIARIGMVGFAPTQGHIPSALPYIGHAMRAMAAGQMRRAMFLCKASLFLNRLTELYDGVSFVLQANE